MALVLFAASFLIQFTAISQCSVTAPDTVSKCINQGSYNLGTGVSISGTTGAVTYSWDGGPYLSSPSKSVAPTVTTTYTLTILDGSGCSASAQVTVKVLPLPVVNPIPDAQICIGQSIQLCSSASSVNGPITLYMWTAGPTSQCRNVSPTSQTSYTAYMQDVAGCYVTDNVTVFVNPLPTVNAGADQSRCLSQGSVQLTGSPSGGTWSGSPAVSSGGLFSPTTAADYTLTYSYTNSNNCTNTDNVVIHVTTPAPIDGGQDLELCLNTPAVQLPNVGTWSGSTSVSSNGLFTPNSVGIHSLTVTSGAPSCQVTDNVQVNVLSLPVVNAGVDIPICLGQCTQLSATATSSNGSITNISWSGTPISNNAILNPNVCPTGNTTYSIQVTDNKNCQATDAINVMVNNLPVVNAGADQSRCLQQGSVQLTGTPTGGTWSGSPDVSSSGLLSPTAAIDYTLTYSYTNGNNCTNTDNIVIHVTTPAPINGGQDLELCLNTPAVQLPNVGTWSGSTSVSSSGVFTPNSVGTHNLMVTSGSPGCQVFDNVTIVVLSLPSVNAGIDVPICNGQCTQLNAMASSSNGSITNISWSGTPISNNSILNPNVCPTGNTIYTLQVTDNKNCQSSDALNVTVNSLPSVNAGPTITVCSNASPVTLTGYSPLGGTWSGAGVTSGGIFTPGALGSVTLTYQYTSGANCTASSTRTINVIAPTPVNAGSDIEVCLNTNAVQLQSGGTWSGSSWVSSSGLFTPGAVNDFTLTYSTTVGQCVSTDQLMVHVLPLPVVNAGTDQAVCVGEVVQMNGSATSANGAINSYHWNESFVSDQNISNPTFVASSTTSLTLNATDIKNCTSSDVVVVSVSNYPAVNAGNDITVCQNQSSVTLVGATPSGGIWQGTGISSSGVYTITTPGPHTVTYTYTNAGGCTSSDDLIINVQAPDILNAGQDIDLCLNSPALQLSGAGSWAGSGWVSPSGLFTPGAVGNFTLTYSLSNGVCTSTDNLIVHVLALPVANAGLDTPICEGNTYQLSGGASGGDGNYDYEWNNQSLLNHPTSPNPILTATSTTTMTLTVTDGNDCSSSDHVTITVVPLPTAVFSVQDVACSNTPIHFTNTSTNATSYNWSFGNTTTSNVISPDNTYLLTGIYNVTLTAYNSLMCADDESMDVEIIGLPNASFIPSVTSGCSPLNVSFENQSTGQYLSYQWNFGSSTSTDETPTPMDYMASGNVQSNSVSLVATNICGSDTHLETISVNPPPTAEFNTSLSTQCSPVLTHFFNTSTGNATSYHWELGDGAESDAVQPAPKIYMTDDEPEEYIIKLYAYNQCGSDVHEDVLTVLPNTVEMNMAPSVSSGCSPLFVQFANNTIGATNYHYNFDDGETSSLQSPAHIFENAGQYEIVYTANDGCSFDTLTATIEVLQSPTIAIQSDVASICPFENVHFSSNTSGNVTQVHWNFGDGANASALEVDHSFELGNIYNIGATAVAQNSCEANASMLFTVNPKPHAEISITEATGCSPFTVCIQNLTTGASAYNWDFGNGFVTGALEPCSEYLNTSTSVNNYTVSLSVENEFGCSDQTSLPIQVQPQPTTSFTLSDTESCFHNESVHVNLITNGSSSYEWYTDDVLISTEMTPTLQFNGVGAHEVEVVSSNGFGCTDSHTESFIIHPTPNINILPNSIEGCAPLSIHFQNTTSNGSIYQWTFSDGQISSDSDAEVTFDDEGIYSMQLDATSEHGCESSMYFEDLIEVYALPNVLFSVDSDEEVLYETTVSFVNSSDAGLNYMWDFGDGGFSNDSSAVHEYTRGGDFEVVLTGETEHGCQSSFSQIIRIDNTMFVYVPSAFTPGTDGVNDVFIPSFSSPDEIKDYSFQVLDRWGEIIFETKNPKEGWIGEAYNGKHYVHNDIFNWIVIVGFTNGQPSRMLTGDVIVIR